MQVAVDLHGCRVHGFRYHGHLVTLSRFSSVDVNFEQLTVPATNALPCAQITHTSVSRQSVAPPPAVCVPTGHYPFVSSRQKKPAWLIFSLGLDRSRQSKKGLRLPKTILCQSDGKSSVNSAILMSLRLSQAEWLWGAGLATG